MISPVYRSALPLFALVSGLAACASDDGAARAPQAIAGGVNDTTHTNVVGIAIVRSAGIGSCTGSLIAPDLVLTARHCVSPVAGEGILCSNATLGGVARAASTTQDTYPAASFYVTTEATISQLARFTGVAEVIVPADSTGEPFCGLDIALLRLTTPITNVGLVRPRLDVAPRMSEVFTASGYGSTNGAGEGAGRRRMRDGLLVQHVGMAVTRGVTVIDEREWLADTGTCRGDSGGPALDSLGEVFGVLSRGASNACESPIYTRVDLYADWLRAQAAQAAAAGGYAPPSWVAPPEPRPGAMGDACSSDAQCDTDLVCLPTGTARECTTLDCEACPEGWLCDVDSPRCVRDPALAPPPPPPPPADAAPVEPADAAVDAPAEAGAPDARVATAAAQESGCGVARKRSGEGLSRALVMLAVMAALGARRGRRRASRA